MPCDVGQLIIRFAMANHSDLRRRRCIADVPTYIARGTAGGNGRRSHISDPLRPLATDNARSCGHIRSVGGPVYVMISDPHVSCGFGRYGRSQRSASIPKPATRAPCMFRAASGLSRRHAQGLLPLLFTNSIAGQWHCIRRAK